MIDNLYDLSNTITAVANRALEIVAERSSSSQRYISYDDVSDLISEEDYLQYLDFIACELQGRAEVLDLDISDQELDIVCGLKWCKNYEPLPEEDDILRYDLGTEALHKSLSMSRLAEIGEKAIQQMILNGPDKPFDISKLDVTEEELSYMRTITGFDQPDMNIFQSLIHSAPTPVTENEYEELQIQAAMRYDLSASAGVDPERIFIPGTNSTSLLKDPHPFYVCVHQDGSFHDKVLDQYPGTKKLFHKIFAEDPQTPASRWGAMIQGRPAIIFSYEYDGNKLPFRDPNVCHSLAAMKAGQLQEAFSGCGVKFTYGIGSSYHGNDELLAIVPADGDIDFIREFEDAFANVMESLPFTKDPLWVEEQHKAIYKNAREQLSHAGPYVSAWTKELPEAAAIHSCRVLGAYLGRNHLDCVQAQLTHDEKKLARLTDKCNAAQNKDLLSAVVQEGIYHAENALSKRVTLYTHGNESPAEPFTLPLGQLTLALKTLGYSQEQSLSDFFMSYHSDDVKEIRSMAEKAPRPSLSHQLHRAEQRRKADEPTHDTHSNNKEPGHDF